VPSDGGSDAGQVSDGGSDAGVPSDGGAFVTIPLTGCPFTAYSAPVTIGGQTFLLQIDTGSTDTGVALATCTNCGVSPPEYDPADGGCSGSTSVTYGSGSWQAEVCSASVEVGTELPAVTIDFAGITSQSGFFLDHDCNGNAVPSLSQGILGLGPIDLDTLGTNSDDAYFNELVKQGITDTLAVLLCSTDGYLWFGGYDAQYASGSPQFTPMTSSAFWTVSLSSVGLGTASLGGADNQAIVDTGTWGFFMPSSAYAGLVSAISSDDGGAAVFGAGTLSQSFFNQGQCAVPSGGQTQAQIDAALPPMTLTFPRDAGTPITLSLPATESYLAPETTSAGTTYYCAGVADEGAESGLTILGDSVLRANITVFDEGNSQIGFVPQSYCQ
jgi:hypothetical protein